MVLLFIWSIIASILVFQYYREKQYKTESLNAELQIHNQYLINAIESGEDYKKYTTENIAHFDSIRITIISLDGSVVYDSKLNAKILDNHLKRHEISLALKHGSGFHIGRQSDSDGRKYFYSATMGNQFIARSAIPYTDSLQELLRADRFYIWTIICISTIFSIVAYFTSRRLGNNITRLKQFAQDAENGKKINKQLTFPSDDLGKISNSIISLYSDLQQTITERDMEHEAVLREEQHHSRA